MISIAPFVPSAVVEEDGHFERAECPAGVAVTDVGQECDRVVMQFDLVAAKSPVGVIHRAKNQRFDLGGGEGLELEDLAATDEGPVHAEEGIGRRRSDEGDDPLFNVGEECILLGPVEVGGFRR